MNNKVNTNMNNMENFNDVKDNPVFKAFCKAFGVSENDIKIFEDEMEKCNKSVEEEPEKPKETPKETTVADICEFTVPISKENVESILMEWKAIEDEVYRLDKEFGINIWDTDKENIYNRYNKIIRYFLEMCFGPEVTDILEDWVFGYKDDERPSFDSLWNNIVIEED